MAARESTTTTDQYAAGRDQSRDTSDRFRGDSLLREWGFQIHARPADGAAVWQRAGKLYTDRDARVAALALRAKALKKLENQRL